MTLKSSGRTKLDVGAFTESCDKAENAIFGWTRKYSWIVAEYEKLQKELACFPKKYSETKKGWSPSLVKRNAKPFPETTSREIGWLSTKEEWKLERWGPDNWKYPMSPPED